MIGTDLTRRYGPGSCKGEAVNVLSARVPQRQYQGFKTQTHDTKPSAAEGVLLQVIEEMVGTRRLELLTSTVSIFSC